jgi:hypothetical protein
VGIPAIRLPRMPMRAIDFDLPGPAAGPAK